MEVYNVSIVEHARRELLRYSMGNPVPWQNGMAHTVMGLVTQLAEAELGAEMQIHAVDLLRELVAGWVITPLTGGPDEWGDPIAEGSPVRQNIRYPWVFTDGERSWDTNAVWYENPKGERYMLGGEIADIVFPYTPTTRTVLVDEDGHPIEPSVHYA